MAEAYPAEAANKTPELFNYILEETEELAKISVASIKTVEKNKK